ncbi:hypothetical protein KXQ82_13095 [Mucilaginibacter sp. HMF5004]|uniref:hypothetical protein n=1 Tax=Mucilaginibacter rivuli TaxID=2857527 RepID=UPI001C5D8C9A|nr:hypothetical protein [Mucilaginibacter rivuli]MBW4890665.1 hypothetical protein [Mucilaginibacter rivuli]
MVQLNDEQVDLVFERVIAGGVTDTALQNDLLDHYCCFIETELDVGTSFEDAYARAFIAISPNGAGEIEHELILILTFKKILMMKRMIYGCGFLAMFCLSMGLMFRSAHWPGVQALTLSGFVFLIITAVVLLSSFVKHIKKHPVLYNVRMFTGFTAIFLISAGSIFKALLFPGSNILVLAGMVLLNLVFLPMFFYHLYKQALQSHLNN